VRPVDHAATLFVWMVYGWGLALVIGLGVLGYVLWAARRRDRREQEIRETFPRYRFAGRPRRRPAKIKGVE